jgi:hypothetical protein
MPKEINLGNEQNCGNKPLEDLFILDPIFSFLVLTFLKAVNDCITNVEKNFQSSKYRKPECAPLEKVPIHRFPARLHALFQAVCHLFR